MLVNKATMKINVQENWCAKLLIKLRACVIILAILTLSYWIINLSWKQHNQYFNMEINIFKETALKPN